MSEEDFGDALTRALPGLQWYASLLTRSPLEAEDLVQETAARALTRAASFRGDASLSTWLHRILHNLVVDESRKRHDFAAGPTLNLLDADEVEARWRQDRYTIDPEVVAQRGALREELRDALIRLPVHYRSAVLLHDLEEMTVAEIARVHGIKLPAAKQRLRRGRILLVTALSLGHERFEATRGVPLGCWDVRRHIHDYLDDELDERERALLERHLEICPTCPPLYAGLVGASAAVHHLRDRDNVIPRPTIERILSRKDSDGACALEPNAPSEATDG